MPYETPAMGVLSAENGNPEVGVAVYLVVAVVILSLAVVMPEEPVF